MRLWDWACTIKTYNCFTFDFFVSSSFLLSSIHRPSPFSFTSIIQLAERPTNGETNETKNVSVVTHKHAYMHTHADTAYDCTLYVCTQFLLCYFFAQTTAYCSRTCCLRARFSFSHTRQNSYVVHSIRLSSVLSPSLSRQRECNQRQFCTICIWR